MFRIGPSDPVPAMGWQQDALPGPKMDEILLALDLQSGLTLEKNNPFIIDLVVPLTFRCRVPL